MTHPYFTAKAQALFITKGGDPDNAGALAAWAEQAKANPTPGRGVIVTEDGELIAETLNNPRAWATYVADADAKRWDLWATELGMAMGTLTKASGKSVIHVRESDVTSGASHFTPAV
jgi:hypothetical protein